MITDGKESASRRSFAVETINRYIFCLNKVVECGVISSIDLQNSISEVLEKEKPFEIDKRTLKNIVEKLEHDNLVQTVRF